jgi:hypothetical protein
VVNRRLEVPCDESLSNLTAQHLQERYAALLRQGQTRGRRAAAVRRTQVILHHMLKDAMRLGLVQRNISEMADPPRAKQQEGMVLTPQEARTFLQAYLK